jgi:hypothetical protein
VSVHRYRAREMRYAHFRQTDAPLLADGRLRVALQQLLLPPHQRLCQDRVALDGGPHRQLLGPSGGGSGGHIPDLRRRQMNRTQRGTTAASASAASAISPRPRGTGWWTAPAAAEAWWWGRWGHS